MESTALARTADLDSRWTKEKGVTKNNMEKNNTGLDEVCCYWMGECHKSLGLGDLAGPCTGVPLGTMRMSE